MKAKKVVTKEGESRWEVVGWTAGRGSKYLRRRFDRKIDADLFIDEQRENGKNPKTLFTMTEQTFAEESRHWLAHRGVEFSPGHMKRARDALDKWILPAIGGLTLDKINPVIFSNYRMTRLEAGLKAATVNRETEVMMAVLNYAVKQQRIPYNPAAGFTKLEEIREDMQFWEREEATAFLSYAARRYPAGSDNRWVFVAYLVLLNTSIRAGECWGLMPKDLVQGGEILHIQRQFDCLVKGFRPPKGKKSRKVPCNVALKTELLALIEQKQLRPDQTFFCTSSGRPMDHRNFAGRYFERDAADAGIKKIRPHDLRHTATTLMIADRLDLRTVQEICGHKKITTTMGYSHLLGESIREASRSFSVVPNTENEPVLAVTS